MQEKLKAEWEALAPSWIDLMRNGVNAHRNGLLDEAMLSACGEVEGLKILDCGCGEGRFCRMLAERGAAEVLGIDLCEPLIEAARNRPADGLSYKLGNVENLEELETASYDLIVSYLNQCDLENFNRNNEAVFRLLKPGGHFIVCNIHPMRSAVGGWKKNAVGEKEHAVLDHYFEEGPRTWKMLDVDFTNFHRSLSTYMNAFLQAGFSLQQLIEPRPTNENIIAYPDIEDEIRVPNFIIYILEKG